MFLMGVMSIPNFALFILQEGLDERLESGYNDFYTGMYTTSTLYFLSGDSASEMFEGTSCFTPVIASMLR